MSGTNFLIKGFPKPGVYVVNQGHPPSYAEPF